MTDVHLQPPKPLDLLDAGRAGSIIQTTEADLAQLKRQALDAEAAADRAEAEARESGVDLESAPWAIVRLQRFLDAMRDEVTRDAEMMVEVARRQSRAMVEDARANPGSPRFVTAAPTSGEPSPSPTSGAAEAVVTPTTAPPPVSPFAPPAAVVATPEPPSAPVPVAPVGTAAATPPPVGEPVVVAPPAPVVAEAPPVVAEAPPVVADPPPPSVGPAVGPPDPAPAPPPVGVAAAPAPVPAEPTLTDTPPVSAPGPAPAVAELTGPSEAPAAPAPAVAKPRRGLKALPMSVVLEVLAVVLILVFILLRLG